MGGGGQSLGAFIMAGLFVLVEGEENDYVDKGLRGGVFISKPPEAAPYAPGDNEIVGNTFFCCATGGMLCATGISGDRFEVRTLKGTAVIEGAGDHC
ncbi:hypothetical protein, partial [Chroococcidiopsis sp. TS-821]|uniref:GltB/FmdC/FwdC-like GXGXG domain-containing protein n=1 Tax=Chroococcidiopsis sp. TS-821 TaxID=1378066 RepID=UPI002112AC9B